MSPKERCRWSCTWEVNALAYIVVFRKPHHGSGNSPVLTRDVAAGPMRSFHCRGEGSSDIVHQIWQMYSIALKGRPPCTGSNLDRGRLALADDLGRDLP